MCRMCLIHVLPLYSFVKVDKQHKTGKKILKTAFTECPCSRDLCENDRDLVVLGGRFELNFENTNENGFEYM